MYDRDDPKEVVGGLMGFNHCVSNTKRLKELVLSPRRCLDKNIFFILNVAEVITDNMHSSAVEVQTRLLPSLL